MIVPGSVNPLLLATGGYDVPYSLRFRAANGAYLSRTSGASPTNQNKVTYSAWIKAAPSISSSTQIDLVCSSGNNGIIGWNNAGGGGKLFIRSDSANDIQFAGLFRDPSAWGNLVISIDTTQATSGDRVKVYWNGSAMTYVSGTYPSLNSNTFLNAASTVYRIFSDIVNVTYLDGYLAEMYMIDGQALTPSIFGQTDSATGVWVPKKYSGTYGTNGFYLKFADASAATATAIGKDSSGNGNNWTPSGISVTSGVTFDQMLDTPTLNYAVWNPLDSYSSTYSSYANMRYGVGTGVGYVQSRSTFQLPSSGKWYWEITFTSNGASPTAYLGIASTSESLALNTVTGGEVRSVYTVDGKSYDGTTSTTYGAAISTSSVVGIAADMDNGTIKFSVGGNYANGSGSFNQTYSAGASAFTDLVSSGKKWSPWAYIVQAYADVNFGQRAFNTDAPTGFKALNTANIASAAVTTSGSFTGNAAADGPFIWANGNPATLTINGNAVTFGTHADKTAGGFKLRTSSASYNTSGTNNWTATAGNRFVQSKKPNNAQVNP